MREILERNALGADDLVSCIFTLTPDLDAQFPAAAARAMGLSSRAAAVRAGDPGPGRAAEDHPGADPRLHGPPRRARLPRRGGQAAPRSHRRSVAHACSADASGTKTASSTAAQARTRAPGAREPHVGRLPVGEPNSSRTPSPARSPGSTRRSAQPVRQARDRARRSRTGTSSGRSRSSRSRRRHPGRGPSGRATPRPRDRERHQDQQRRTRRVSRERCRAAPSRPRARTPRRRRARHTLGHLRRSRGRRSPSRA